MWIPGQISCKSTGVWLRLALIRLTGGPWVKENIISHSAFVCCSSFLEAKGKIKSLWHIWGQRREGRRGGEATQRTPGSGFHVSCPSYVSHQSRTAEAGSLSSITFNSLSKHQQLASGWALSCTVSASEIVWQSVQLGPEGLQLRTRTNHNPNSPHLAHLLCTA